MMGFGFIVMALFWGGLILGGIWLVKTLFSTGQPLINRPENQQPSAREILDRRYAHGEISREEYEQIKADL